MKITLHPMRHSAPLSLHRAGDVLTINGAAYDFGPVPDGATLPRAAIACDWIAGDVQRINGVLHVPIILPHGANAPEAARFPAPITLTGDGDVILPAYEEMPDDD